MLGQFTQTLPGAVDTRNDPINNNYFFALEGPLDSLPASRSAGVQPEPPKNDVDPPGRDSFAPRSNSERTQWEIFPIDPSHS